MFFSADDDENDFVAPGKSSKLASLFDSESLANEEENTSLKYTAPKEPKKKKTGEEDHSKSSSQSTKVLCAGVVHSYKYVDGKYEAQGKLGAAVLGENESFEYKILLYRTKQQPVTQARITPTFVFSLQKNNYVTMYDDARVTWSLNFDSTATLEQFAKNICIARAGSAGSDAGTSVLISQQTTYGDGPQVEAGDSLEISHQAWVFEKGQLEQSIVVTGANTHRFKLGKGKAIKGFEDGLVGVRKSCKCFLIIPPSFGIPSELKGKVAANAVIAYDVTVLRVKINREVESEAGSKETSRSSTPQPEADAQALPPPATAGANSEKAKLISRMAKMGKPMLPMTGIPTHHEEEEHVQEEGSQSPGMKPSIASKPKYSPHQSASQPLSHPHSNQHPVHTQPEILPHHNPPSQQQHQFGPGVYGTGVGPAVSQLAVYHNPMQYQSPYGPPPPQYANMYGPPPAPYQQPAPPPSTSTGSTEVVLAETRQNNTELRLSISKLTEKIDRVYEKVDNVSSRQMQLSTSSMPNMEAGVLLHNITRIVQDNERLKQELFDKNNKVENQNEKINELIQRNQKYIEQSNLMLEQRSDTFKQTATDTQSKVLALEQDKVKLTSELSSSVSQISSLQLEITSLKKRELEIKQQLDSLLVSDQDQKSELAGLRLTNTENGNRVEQLSTQVKEERRGRKEADARYHSLNEEHQELQHSLNAAQKTLADRKRKAAEEKQELERELEEVKAGLEKEITDLKEKLKKERSNTDVTTAEKISKVEEELTVEWKEKSERLLAATTERHKRALAEIHDEKLQLEEKITALENKVSMIRSSHGESSDQVTSLQEELKEMTMYKTKYEKLQDSLPSIKEKYEGRISELEDELEKGQGETSSDKVREENNKLQLEVAALKSDLQSYRLNGAHSQVLDRNQLNTEVKKIMSSVYQSIRRQFEPEESYEGADIHSITLDTIKAVTLKLLAHQEEEVQRSEVQSSVVEQTDEPSTTSASVEQKVEAVEQTKTSELADVSQTEIVGGNDAEHTEQVCSDVVAGTGRVGGNPYYAQQLEQAFTKSSVKSSQSESEAAADGSPPLKDESSSVTDSHKPLDNSGQTDHFQDESEQVNISSTNGLEADSQSEITSETQHQSENVTNINSIPEQPHVIQSSNTEQEESISPETEENECQETLTDGSVEQTNVVQASVVSKSGITGGNSFYAQELQQQEKDELSSVGRDRDESEAVNDDKEEVMSSERDSAGRDESEAVNDDKEEVMSSEGEQANDSAASERSGEHLEPLQNDLLKSLPKSGVVTNEAVKKPPAFRALEESDSDDDLFKPIPKASIQTQQKNSAVPDQDEKASEEKDDEQQPVLNDPLLGSATAISSSTNAKLVNKSTVKSTQSVTKTSSAKNLTLFTGNESSDEDFFSSKPAAPPTAGATGVSSKTSTVPSSQALADSDSDESARPKPPPLFGDDDDDDDLDWFSKA